MNVALKYREPIADARRVVVKIGTGVLVRRNGRIEHRRVARLVQDLAGLWRRGLDLLVVTSGAIGAGMEALGMRRRPAGLPDLQMAAAVGQCRLMGVYGELFSARGCTVGQVLLTHDDFNHRIRLTNARRTMENLLRHRVVPIINENDVVADEEIRADIRLGDNDFLASLVVKLVRADLLILLTTVDGLRAPADGGGTRRVEYLESVNRRTFALVAAHNGPLSVGGMASKLRAAQTAARAGCSVVIADGRQPRILERIMRGENVGTLVLATLGG